MNKYYFIYMTESKINSAEQFLNTTTTKKRRHTMLYGYYDVMLLFYFILISEITHTLKWGTWQ